MATNKKVYRPAHDNSELWPGFGFSTGLTSSLRALRLQYSRQYSRQVEEVKNNETADHAAGSITQSFLDCLIYQLIAVL